MSGNSFGKLFKVTTFGESHGQAIGAIIDGCPAGLELDVCDIQPDLDKRKPGTNKFVTQRKEDDKVQILSGVFLGKTTGTPIGLLIYNTDQKSKDYNDIKDKYRPGHADYTYDQKYGFRDYRGGGRSSARETAMRVAAGAIAKKILNIKYGIKINTWVSQIGEISFDYSNPDFIDKNTFYIADPKKLNEVENYLANIRKSGNSVGAKVSVIASGVPAGIGDPVFDRLDADIAKAMMSINASKAVSIGSGFDCVTQLGTEHRDEMRLEGFLSNNAGGILGGISTGQVITADIAFKPTSSLIIPGKTIDKNGKEVQVITKGRHDPCVGIRAVPVVSAMLAITLIDHLLRNKSVQL